MKEYRNTDNPKYVLTNARLIPWLAVNADPSKWVIELTGGEPALYKGINPLCQWLSAHKYRTLIKTNGTVLIQPQPNVIRVAAFHRLEEPPKYFDKILIVDKIDREAKEAYCREQGWDYCVIGYDKENPDHARHGFRLSAYMDPHGHPVPCKNRTVKYTEQPDKYALEYTGIKTTLCCPDCKAAIDAWRFMPESWKL